MESYKGKLKIKARGGRNQVFDEPVCCYFEFYNWVTKEKAVSNSPGGGTPMLFSHKSEYTMISYKKREYVIKGYCDITCLDSFINELMEQAGVTESDSHIENLVVCPYPIQ